MSISHHSSEDESAKDRLIDQILGRAREHFQDGRLNRKDEGDLSFAIAADPKNQVVLITFGKPVAWIGMPKRQALALADMLREKCGELNP